MLSSTTNRAQVRHDRMGDIGEQAGVRLVILIRSVNIRSRLLRNDGIHSSCRRTSQTGRESTKVNLRFKFKNGFSRTLYDTAEIAMVSPRANTIRKQA